MLSYLRVECSLWEFNMSRRSDWLSISENTSSRETIRAANTKLSRVFDRVANTNDDQLQSTDKVDFFHYRTLLNIVNQIIYKKCKV